jgi:TRAP-type C4-dicarboxylate transport system substrate-binding protein
MNRSLSRRRVVASAVALLAAPALRRAAASDASFRLRCSLDTVPTHTRNAIIRDYLAKIETATRGAIKTQLFESGQLFPDLQIGKALLQGQVEMAVPGCWTLTGIIPDADFFQLPILYGRTLEMVHRAVDGRPGQLVAQQIEQKLNAQVMGPWLDLGPFNWYSTGRPLNSYDDLKGLKIRNSGGVGQAWRTRFMGAVPNTTPLPNVALGLSQGTFDGLITTNETIASAQFWESGVRHGFEDRQFTGVYVPIVSRDFWQKLTPGLQQILTEVWRENITDYRARMAVAQARARALVQSHGVKIVVPADDELAAKRREMLSHQKHLATQSLISPEMLTALGAELGNT